jgi:hypothetical protein
MSSGSRHPVVAAMFVARTLHSRRPACAAAKSAAASFQHGCACSALSQRARPRHRAKPCLPPASSLWQQAGHLSFHVTTARYFADLLHR